jgi:hypothetical protein
MAPKKTDGNQAQQVLTPEQEAALSCLLAGKTPQQTAGEAGIAEDALQQWLTGDALFVATLNQRRRERWDAHQERLRALAGKAINALEDLLEHTEDERVRFQVAMGVLRVVSDVGEPTDKTTPEDVRDDWKSQERWRDLLRTF